MKRTFSLLLALCLILGLLSGCGASSTPADAGHVTYAENEKSEAYDVSPGELTDGSTALSAGDAALTENRKLIKTVYLDAESTAYDTLIEGLVEKVAQLGGYVESRESYNSSRNHCNMTIRIPAENLSSFVTHVQENANLTHSSETTEDVTLQYTDTEARILALETEQARLLELLAQAQNLSEILEIEARLSDVTYELEYYASQMRVLENQIDYATIHLSLYEVKVLTPVEPQSVWQRIAAGFPETLKELWTNITDAFVWVVVQSPNILVTVVLVVLVYRLGKFLVPRGGLRRRRRKSTDAGESQQ